MLHLLASLAAPVGSLSLKLAPVGSLSAALLEAAVAVVVLALGQELWETRMLVPLLASVLEKVSVGTPSAALEAAAVVPALEQVPWEMKMLVVPALEQELAAHLRRAQSFAKLVSTAEAPQQRVPIAHGAAAALPLELRPLRGLQVLCGQRPHP